MKKVMNMVGICFAFATLTAQTSFADNPRANNKKAYQIPSNVTEKDYLKNTVVVKIDSKYKNQLQRNAIAIPEIQTALSSISATKVYQQFPNAVSSSSRMPNGKMAPDITSIYKIEYSKNISIQEVINNLAKLECVVYAEPSFVYHLDYIPNDPDTLTNKNYYQKIIKAYEAWNVSKGDTNTVIGIVDSGGDLDHPDLAANVKYNHADPIDGLDNDNDGYIDNYAGWDLVGNTLSPFTPDGNPNVVAGGSDHGVHVGGDASARPDNNVGIAGVGFNCKLLFIKTTTDDYSNSIYTGYEGIVYAADHGADIINCSWGGTGGGSAGQDVIDYAISKGSLVVAAAGNSNIEDLHFPSAYDGVFAVGSTTSTDRKSSFSNFGYWVDASAPGSGIYSTVYNDAYASYDGTSMASPVAAGAAALVKSHFPNYNGLQVGEQLRVTADDITSKNSSSFKDKLGKGRINVYRALTESTPSIRLVSYNAADNNNGSYLPGDTITLGIEIINYLQSTSNLQVELSTTSVNATVSNATKQIGSVATLAKANAEGFKIFLKTTTPENAKIPLKLTYTDGAYVDVQYINLEVNLSSINITVNQLQSTATGNGRVGFRNGDATGGLGIRYKGFNMLYEASMMIAASASQVSNNSRSETAVADEHFLTTKRIGVESVAGVDFMARGEFNDLGNLNQINVSVKHRTFAWASAPDDKYIIVQHKIKNNNPNALSGIYAGMFYDLDISNYLQNKVLYDTLTRMAVASTYTPGEPYLAIKILSTTAAPAYYGQANGELPQDGGFSIAEKYATLSSGIVNPAKGDTGTGMDIMFSIGAGPYTIASNAEAEIAYAIIAGDDVNDINASAAAAQAKYDGFVSTVGINNASINRNLITYPNPTNRFINVTLPNEEQKVSVKIFDMFGKKVYDENVSVTGNSFNIDLQELNTGMYILNIGSDKEQYVEKIQIQK